MFDCLEQLELFAACFLQLRRTLVDLIPDWLSFIVDKNCIILLFCTQIPAVTINILLTTKVKSPNRVDDPDLADKLYAEMEGILLWAFEGSQRLVANRFRFSESERSRQNRELLKQDGNNLLMFLESEDYIQFDSVCAATSKELMAAYAIWCDDNGFAPLKSRTVSDFLISNASKYHIEHTNNIHSVDGRQVWGFKGIRLMIDAAVRSQSGFQRVYAMDNPFE